ncbi:MAG: hypothetical protein N2484_01400 [Clostridia bacterium]|nr:hypothetical protein [Clostridia bacterium]
MLFTLIKLQLNINFGISALKYRFRKEKTRLWEPVLVGLGIFVGIGSITLMMTMLMLGIFIAGKSVNHPEMVLTIAFVGGPFVVLIFGLFYIISAFYFSKDMDILIPLPLKPHEILGSKLAVVMVNEYLTLIPVIIPAILVYGIGTGQGFIYWLKSLILLVLSPVIPLAIGALIVVVLMRLINVRKSKDFFAVVGGFLSLLFGLGINFFAQRIPKGHEAEFFKQYLGQAGLIEHLGQKYPPSIWATYGLSLHNMKGNLDFLLYIAVSALLLLALVWIGNRFFYASILSGQEVTRKRRVLSADEMERSYRKESSPLMALLSREWKLLLRTPVYALNGLAGIIIGPFMVIMMFTAQREQREELFKLINNPEYIVPVSLGGLAFMLFTSGMNIVASTSISREGKSFWISKMIPAAASQQVMAKFLNSFLISAFGTIITGIVLVGFLNFAIWRTLVLIGIGLLGAGLIVCLNLMIDVLRPKLEWTNPQEAVKQNLNGFLGVLVSLLVIGILTGVSVAFIITKLPEWIIYLLLALIIAVLLIPSLWGLIKLSEWKYKNIEV